MASPDVAAAECTPQWRSRPIPRSGDHIRLTGLIKVPGSHFLSQTAAAGVVSDARLDCGQIKNDLLIRLVDDPTEYVLRQSTSACNWALVAAAGRDLVAPLPEQPATPAMPVDSMSIVELERRLLAVKNRLAAITGEEAALKAEAAQLSELIRDTALEQEMDSLPAVDGMTAYFSPVYFVERRIDEATGKQFTTADVIEALKESGHDYLLSVGYNGNQLRALAREIKIDHDRPLPPALARVITLSSRYDVNFTPMGARKRRAAPRNEQ